MHKLVSALSLVGFMACAPKNTQNIWTPTDEVEPSAAISYEETPDEKQGPQGEVGDMVRFYKKACDIKPESITKTPEGWIVQYRSDDFPTDVQNCVKNPSSPITSAILVFQESALRCTPLDQKGGFICAKR